MLASLVQLGLKCKHSIGYWGRRRFPERRGEGLHQIIAHRHGEFAWLGWNIRLRSRLGGVFRRLRRYAHRGRRKVGGRRFLSFVLILDAKDIWPHAQAAAFFHECPADRLAVQARPPPAEQINHPDPYWCPYQATVVSRYAGIAQADSTIRRAAYQHHRPVHSQLREYLIAGPHGDLRWRLGVICPISERIPIFRGPIPQPPFNLSSHRKLKSIGADLNALSRTHPTCGARHSPPADARATAQVYAEDPSADLLQVGVPPADRLIFQAEAVMLIPANQDEGLIEDALFHRRPSRPCDFQRQRGGRAAARPEQFDRVLAQ